MEAKQEPKVFLQGYEQRRANFSKYLTNLNVAVHRFVDSQILLTTSAQQVDNYN